MIMMKHLEGKKLLLLGGSSTMIDIVKLAQSFGCIVYVTDFYDSQKSPAKLVADCSADISVADYKAIVTYIKENEIDGVMTGYTDSYLEHYISICEMAGLPYYGSRKAFGIATDKMLFKKACREAGVKTIPGTNAYKFETVLEFASSNGFPLMLKPTDNSGSRGVIKCENANELRKCFDYAMSFSASKNVIVEKYMDCESIGIVYQFDGKEPILAAICDREIYSSREDGSAIISGLRYPSKYLDRYIKEADASMKKMLKDNMFFGGMVSPMAFVDSDGFYMCEMCYRPSGGHHFVLINDQNSVNGLALLIEFALTGRNESYQSNKETPYFKDCCGMTNIIGTPNKTIAHISGIEDIRKIEGVIDIYQSLRQGQKIGKDGTTAQRLLSVWLKANSWEQYNKLINIIKTTLVVQDEYGQSLIVK